MFSDSIIDIHPYEGLPEHWSIQVGHHFLMATQAVIHAMDCSSSTENIPFFIKYVVGMI